MVLYVGNVVQKFYSLPWYDEDAIRMAKCTGGIGEHVGKFASMKTNTWCTLYSHVSNVLPQIYEDGTAFCS